MKVYLKPNNYVKDLSKVFAIAQKWEKYVNLKLTLTSKRLEADIRVYFDENERSSYSYVGTENKNIPKI